MTYLADPLILKALVAGLLVSIIAGFLGCIIVWKRISVFSDTLAHGIIPGVALGFIYNVDLFWAAFFTAMLIALAVEKFRNRISIPIDAVLVIISQIMFSLGVIIVYTAPGMSQNLMGYLLGDILAVTLKDIVTIAAISIVLVAFLAASWGKIVLICLNEDIARCEGVNVGLYNILIMVLAAVFTAFALQTVGIILAGSLLLIPAASARRFSKSPKTMPLIAAGIGMAGTAAGLGTSSFYDIPTSPAIVISLGVILLLSSMYKKC